MAKILKDSPTLIPKVSKSTKIKYFDELGCIITHLKNNIIDYNIVESKIKYPLFNTTINKASKSYLNVWVLIHHFYI